eukprot:CAMPEP_0168841608 /NCGR_PEP_ID=MMETSP0727-20121128/7265_1 /TAXON_ID=265536 /ORGANISM="Amphiprora sp., Strain CCMP467" /LENGTH=84 /DNA_ID=CAMNT_0008895137 /DNA_START=646 /DNA_END=900 /DNA_ORIENTATION=-
MAQVTRPGGARRIPPRFPCRKKDQSTPTRKRTVLQSLIPNHDESGLNRVWIGVVLQRQAAAGLVGVLATNSTRSKLSHPKAVGR